MNRLGRLATGLLLLPLVGSAAEVTLLSLEQALGAVEKVNLSALVSRENAVQAAEAATAQRSQLLPIVSGTLAQRRSEVVWVTAVGNRGVRDHTAVADLHDALGALGDVRLVRDHHDRHAAVVELLEQGEDLLGDAAVEVARRLVGEEHAGVRDERPCDRDALLLAARHLGRSVPEPLSQANALEGGDSLWHAIIASNLHGTYHCCKAALPKLPDGSGRIVNIASVLGLRGVPDQTAYCAAKHGVVGFTRALALSLAPRGITVNALCPGWVDTDMAAARYAELNAIYKAEADARPGHAYYIDTWSLLNDPSGQYSDDLVIGGAPQRARAPDGIHFTRAGGDVIADAQLKKLGEFWDLVSGRNAPMPTASTAPTTQIKKK